jgi:diazepam-binding inhibitor (GABA receptor modulating acyl-CoA-binding protein)
MLVCCGVVSHSNHKQQATVGDVQGSQPWAVQLEARAKVVWIELKRAAAKHASQWDAWNKNVGMSKEDAMKAYIALVEKGDPNWATSDIAKSFQG